MNRAGELFPPTRGVPMVLEAETRTDRPRRLLITDPDADWCRHVGRVVEPEGVEPVISDSPEGTYDQVESGGLSAVILGGHWQRPDTLTVLRVIRSIDGELPAVLLTAHATRRVMEDALSLAAFSVLESPVDDRLLAEVVHRLLSKFFERYDV